MTLWTAADAVAATGGKATTDWMASGVSIDTRTLQPGDLFIALKAARDGHDFVAQALGKGAAAALVTHRPDGVAKDAPLLLVDDVQAALDSLGRAGRARTGAKVVAITGSVGKTSTKEMLARILSDQGRTHASVASYNNHWGVPLTLARMPADTQFAVIEIGMNHPGEIAPLARMAAPHAALITTVAPAHLEAFDNIEGIAVEKASILEGLQPGGVAVLNGDIPTYPILRDTAQGVGARIVTFGEAPFCHHRASDVRLLKDTVVVQARAWRTPMLYKVCAPARHFALNALGALAVAWALRADRALSIAALAAWAPYAGRGAQETVYLDPSDPSLALQVIDDAYNANPASMAAALEVLAASPVQHGAGRVMLGRRIAFLGDMKELGPEAPRFHAALADLPALQHIDRVHCIGPMMRYLHSALPAGKQGRWSGSSAEMAQQVRGRIDAGDVVLAKGSLSMDLSLIVDAIRKMGHRHPDPEDEA